MKNHSGENVNVPTDWRTAERRPGSFDVLTVNVGQLALTVKVKAYVWR